MAHDCLKFNVTIFAIKENFWTSSNCSKVGVKSICLLEKNTITSRVDLVCRSSTLLVLKYLSHTNLGPIHCLSRLFLPTKITPIKLFPSKQSQKMFPSNLFILVFKNYVFSVDCAFCTLFAPKSR